MTMLDIGGAEDIGGADDIGAELYAIELIGPELTGAGVLIGAEQSADANGIGTVSVAPASVIRVVVHPQVGIGAPE